MTATQKKFRSFRRARMFVRKLGLKNQIEWRKYCAAELRDYDPRPDDIPAAPDRHYKDNGWRGMGDWLGTGTVATAQRRYKPFIEARAFICSLGMKNIEEWHKYCRGELLADKPKPDDIPSAPDIIYKDKGWGGWGYWLGKRAIPYTKHQCRSFTEARQFARSLGLKSSTEWIKYRAGKLPGYKPKPDDIPSNPNAKYKDEGWVNWSDWLGTFK